MRIPICLVVLISCAALAGAQGQLTGILLLTDDNSTAVINISAPVTWTETVPDNTGENGTNVSSPDCEPLLIEGLPLIAESGEKLSYGFAPWQEGDEVTYWIEDINGDDLKAPVSTTTKTKKQYTPKTEKEQQAFVFKAVRARSGCNESGATAVVVVRGGGEEACECEEVVCEGEEPLITSLYVLAKNYQDEVSLYGNAREATDAWVVGESESQLVSLPQGRFGIVVKPVPGENTFGVAAVRDVVSVAFTLAGGEEEKPEEEPPAEEPIANETNSTSLQPSYSFEPPLTGMVIAENGSGNAPLIIGGGAGLAGLGLAASRIKRKHLRIARRSKNPS